MPQEVLNALDGEALEQKIGPAHLLVTGDVDGTPRPCMLSAGELLAHDEHRLRVALWSGSRTSENLGRGGSALLCYVTAGRVLYVRGRARRLEGAAAQGLDLFELQVDSVESDDHPGMPVTSGLRFSVEHPSNSEVLAGWQRQVQALRSAS